MAATRLIPMHQQKGKSVTRSLQDRTDYAKDDLKTDDGRYVSAYECDPATVDLDFAATKRDYELSTGRNMHDGGVIAYQIRQSFKPGEVTPEEANQIGYETAMRWTKGKHAFIVATHIDKAHIHNHIVYNSTTLDAGHKYRNFFFSSIALRRLSDIICLEHGLSVIEAKKPSEWQKRTEYPKRKRIRDDIRKAVDMCLGRNPKNMEELLLLLQEMDYEVKRGKHIAVKNSAQKSFIRIDSLGDGYREKDLIRILGGKTEPKQLLQEETGRKASFDLILDIQEIIAKGKGPGYEQWAKIHNIKQVAQTICFLHENNIRTIDDLRKKAEETSDRFDSITQRQKEIEHRLSEITELKKQIINYVKTKEIYAEYRKHGYNKRFFEENREALTLHKAAKETFEKMDGPIPKLKDLNEEYASLYSEKKMLYAEYRKAKDEMIAYQKAKYNIEHFLKIDDLGRDEKTRIRGDRSR